WNTAETIYWFLPAVTRASPCIPRYGFTQYSANASSGTQYSQRSPISAEATTGCPLERACLLAWRLGEESQHRVSPHSWQVRRCTHDEPIFTHSVHSRRLACFTLVIAPRWAQPAAMRLSVSC